MQNLAIDYSHLDQRTEIHYQTLLQRVSSRRASETNLDWLLYSSHPAGFMPDYLHLGGLGKNRFERTANRLFHDHALPLWYRTFWPKIQRGLVAYANTRYLPGFFQENADRQAVAEVSRYVVTRFGNLLARPWELAHECASYEMSNFVAAITQEALSAYGFQADMFAERKTRQNQTCLAVLRDIRERLLSHPRCFEIMVYCCCRTNRIDSLDNEFSSFFDDFTAEVNGIMEHGGLLDHNRDRNGFYHIQRVESLLNEAPKRILYESDNCGEIVFDLFLIEYLLSKGHHVDLCAKACPVVNDAMLPDVEALLAEDLFLHFRDALHTGQLTLLSNVMFPGGGKLLYDVSENYKRVYQHADLLLLKGQGNFQTMPMGRRYRGKCIPYRYTKPILFIMEPKVDLVIASFETMFPARRCPEKHSLVVYYYDPLNPEF